MSGRRTKGRHLLVPLVSMNSYKKVSDAARNTGPRMASFSIKVCHDPNTTVTVSLKVEGKESEG